MNAESTIPAVGSLVKFREDTPQYARNKDITYIVDPSPSGEPYSTAGGLLPEDPDRVYVWLVHAADIDKAPSRRRTRTGWVDALTVVPAN